MNWTPEKIERARSLWNAGVTAREMAECFGVTPHAIRSLASNRRDEFLPRASRDPRKGADSLSLAKSRSDAIRQCRELERAATLERVTNPRKIDVLRERDLGMGAG